MEQIGIRICTTCSIAGGKHFSSMKRLEPLLQSIKRAPLEESFKTDISLLVTECIVRAVEIRTMGTSRPRKECARRPSTMR